MQHNNNQETKKLLNSIVEVKIDGKMSLVSLYDDLPHFEYDLTIDNLKNSNKKLETYIQELKQQITKLENENSLLKTNNAVILKNITSLYKTASKEIQRKDNMINELRKSQLYAQPKIESKMFSCNDNQNKHNPALELGIKTHQKRTEVNNILKMNVQPDKHIPQTVYYKRLCHKFAMENKAIAENQIKNKNLTVNAFTDKNIINTVHCKPLCQKFDKENDTIEFENKKLEEIDEIITNKITEDKNEELNNVNKSIHQYDPLSDKSSETSFNTSETNQLPVHFEVEHGILFRNSRKRKVTMLSTSDDNTPITKKGRRVQLITIKNNYSQPIPTFNGAKKTEIDFSNRSIHIEKVVESSSLFYIPQVKKRRTINFGDSNS